MKQPFSYISTLEACEKIAKAGISLLNSELVQTREALGRIAANDIISHLRVPSDDLAHYDGYAIRSQDTSDAIINPALLRVKGRIYPGERPQLSIGKQEAYYITTGAILPNGADAVLAVEMAREVGNDKIQVRAKVNPGEHVIRAGTDVEEGDVVIPRGKVLRSKDIVFLNLLNIDSVGVLRKPIVSILSVGDELVGKVGVHSLLLSRWIEHYGAVPINCNIVQDNKIEIKSSLLKALAKADIILTIGGCSMGEKDLVAEAIGSVGEPGMIFHGIKIRPGRVSGFGVLIGKPIIMLPGLIQSTIVGFYFLFLPLLQQMRGLPLTSIWNTVPARLAEGLEFSEFLSFKKAIFVRIEKTTDGFLARSILGNSSFFNTIAKADGMVIAQENRSYIEKDEIVEVHRLPDS